MEETETGAFMATSEHHRPAIQRLQKKPETQLHSQHSSEHGKEQEYHFLPAAISSDPSVEISLTRLCSMKRQVEFTPHQLDTWMAVLAQFPVTTTNRAILQLGLSSDPFPDLGKLVLCCQQIEWSTSKDYAPARDTSKVSSSVISKAAENLQIKI